MIEINNLSKTFNIKNQKIQILNDINMIISRGDFISIRGSSGSGKTTLLNIMGLLETYETGEYLLEGKDIKFYSENKKAKLRRKEFGYIFQNFNLIENMSALENIAMTMGIDGVKKRDRLERANELIEKLGLVNRKRHLPGELSGGERQRVAIARALSNHPKVLLADEPTGNLDRKNSLEIMNILKDLNHEGIAIILVTHDLEVDQFAKIHYVLKDGVLMKKKMNKMNKKDIVIDEKINASNNET